DVCSSDLHKRINQLTQPYVLSFLCNPKLRSVRMAHPFQHPWHPLEKENLLARDFQSHGYMLGNKLLTQVYLQTQMKFTAKLVQYLAILFKEQVNVHKSLRSMEQMSSTSIR